MTPAVSELPLWVMAALSLFYAAIWGVGKLRDGRREAAETAAAGAASTPAPVLPPACSEAVLRTLDRLAACLERQTLILDRSAAELDRARDVHEEMVRALDRIESRSTD